MVWSLVLLAACTPAPMHVAAVVIDRSDSIEDGKGSACAAVDGIVAHELAAPDADTRSTLQVWMSGDKGTAMSPTRIVGPRALPVAGSMVESDRRTERSRQELRGELDEACRAQVMQAKVSPLVNAVDAGVRSLRDQGCTPADRCTLWVLSDLQETEHGPLVDRIRGRRKGEPRPLAPLDAAGFEVRACGYTGTLGTLEGALTPELRDRTEAAWAELLPGARFTFEPACPG